MKINIEEAKEEFIKDTENFNTKDKNVKRKQQHSIRVMKIAEQIATNLKRLSNVDFNKTYRIVRTEGHRIQQESTYNCQVKAKENGADIVKRWDSTLDKRTRPDHIYLDGQTKNIDTILGELLKLPM